MIECIPEPSFLIGFCFDHRYNFLQDKYYQLIFVHFYITVFALLYVRDRHYLRNFNLTIALL